MWRQKADEGRAAGHKPIQGITKTNRDVSIKAYKQNKKGKITKPLLENVKNPEKTLKSTVLQ